MAGTKFKFFKHAGEQYIPVTNLISWFQREFIILQEDSDTSEELLAYVKRQIRAFEQFQDEETYNARGETIKVI